MAPSAERFFAREADELLERIATGAAAATATGEAAAAGIADLLRAAHTLKGAARIVGRAAIADAAHRIEEIVIPARPSGRLDAGAATAVAEQVAAARRELGGGVAAPASRDGGVARIDVARLDEGLAAIADAVGRAAAIERMTTDLDAVTVRLRALEAASSVGDERSRRLAATAAAEAAHARERIADAAGRLRAGLGDAQDALLDLRLTPIAHVVEAVELAMRDACAGRGKRARLVAAGTDARLDATILADLREMLIHVVRNAVAHGIETPAERAERGKSPDGVVSLAITPRGRRVVIEIADDGAGMRRAALRDAAVSTGRLSRGEADRLDAAGSLDLAFAPGVTTEVGADAIAGRGLGLDAVREAARRLGGRVAIASAPGVGTTVTIDLPATWSTQRLLTVADGDVAACIPLADVRRVSTLDDAALAEAIRLGSVAVDGAVLPLRRLASAFAARAAPRARIAVLTEACALLVERIHGLADPVVRPVPAALGGIDGVAGIAVGATGEVTAVIDVRTLPASKRGETSTVARRTVLVVDDSLTTRMLEQSILEGAGYRCLLASSGEEALATLARERCDAVLVDLEMPGIDGIETISRMRADARTAGVPAIMLSSRAASADRRRALAAGAADYLVKGEFDQTRFLALLAGLVR